MTKRKQLATTLTKQQLPLSLSPPDPEVKSPLDLLTLAERRYLSGPLIQPKLNGWDFPDRHGATSLDGG